MGFLISNLYFYHKKFSGRNGMEWTQLFSTKRMNKNHFLFIMHFHALTSKHVGIEI